MVSRLMVVVLAITRWDGLQALFISDPLLANEVMNATPADGLERDDMYKQFETVKSAPISGTWVTVD